MTALQGFAIAAALLLTSDAPAQSVSAAAAKPNLIVIYTDDHGYADLGCVGVMADVKTPHIDALAGLPKDPVLDGVNLVPYLSGKNPGAPHEVLFWRWTTQFAMRQGDWKYITVANRQYLFNLATDPYEKSNLTLQRPDMAKTLRSRLEQWTETLIPVGFGETKNGSISHASYEYYVDGKPAQATSPKGKRKGKAKGKTAANTDGAVE